MKRPLILSLILVSFACLGIKCSGADKGDAGGGFSDVRLWRAEPVNVFPHDTGAFTQGLIHSDGAFYETTGQYGESRLRKIEPATGKILKEIALSDEVFGEGMTRVGEEYLVLTWKEKKGFTFAETDTGFTQKADKGFSYTGEGWGLAFDGTTLIMSDGTPKLRFLNPVNKMVVREVEVTMDGKPLSLLNELEYFQSRVWANVWQTNYFVGIDPKTGKVTDKVDVDLGTFFAPGERQGAGTGGNVLNGIAFDDKTDRLFITGKRWPKIFEVKLTPAD